jgi:(p)ppGpp synthase/HD superfamily hydrolase
MWAMFVIVRYVASLYWPASRSQNLRLIAAYQLQKSTAIPYVSHLLGLAALVLEGAGGKRSCERWCPPLEDTCATSAQLEEAFGSRVATTVQAGTDT